MNLQIVLNCRDCGNFNRVSSSMFVPLSQCSKDLVLSTLFAFFIELSPKKKTDLMAKSNRRDG